MADRHGYVAWSELMTRDTEVAKAYYAKTCGWDYHAMKMDGGSDYFVALSDGSGVAGIMDMSGMPQFDDVPPHWFTYLGVADVDAATASTEEAGGQVIRPPFDVPGIGRIAIVTDPAGAALGLITEVDHPEEPPSQG